MNQRIDIKDERFVPVGFSQEDDNQISYFSYRQGMVGYWNKRARLYYNLKRTGTPIPTDIGPSEVLKYK